MTTYVVTGANRGLGLEITRRLAARGDRVIAAARRPDESTTLQSLDVRVEQLDVADDGSIAAFAARLGAEPVDVLINNAGVGHTANALDDVTSTELLRVFHVNAVGPVILTKALRPSLMAGGRRVVVSISSIMGSIHLSQGRHYAYRASKAALNMLNRCMALELAPEITCVAMHPGWVKTDMGGADADLTIEKSVTDMLEVIDRLGPDDAGVYIDHTGEMLPW